MSTRDVTGFWVSPARVAFLISLVTLCGVAWKTADFLITQNIQVQAHEKYIEEDKAQTKELLAELKRMNETLIELVVIVKGEGGQLRVTTGHK